MIHDGRLLDEKLMSSCTACRGTERPLDHCCRGEAFKRDLPDAEIHLLDAGHFAFDEKNDEIASLILTFLAKHLA